MIRWEWQCPRCHMLYIGDNLDKVEAWRDRHLQRCSRQTQDAALGQQA